MTKTLDDFINILARVSYPGFSFKLTSKEGSIFLQVVCIEGEDNTTKEPITWTGRKWYLSKFATNSEVVQTCFKAVLTALEHEAREKFTYRGVAVLDAHYDLEQLVSLKKNHVLLVDRRNEP